MGIEETTMSSMELINADCLEEMKNIPSGSIDMVLCDLPYGTTKNRWDSVIPFDELWKQYNRIVKDNGAIVLFAQGLFSSALIQSNTKMFRYNIIWDKKLPTGFLNANKMPLRVHEEILVFYKKLPTYHPQKSKGSKNHVRGSKNVVLTNHNYGKYVGKDNAEVLGDMKHPTSIVSFAKPHSSVAVHPTQKPVDLLEYLIKTYTNEGDVVLDNCMGSGSTGVACVRTNRSFIGIEVDSKYFSVARERIESAKQEIGLS